MCLVCTEYVLYYLSFLISYFFVDCVSTTHPGSVPWNLRQGDPVHVPFDIKLVNGPGPCRNSKCHGPLITPSLMLFPGYDMQQKSIPAATLNVPLPAFFFIFFCSMKCSQSSLLELPLPQPNWGIMMSLAFFNITNLWPRARSGIAA
jgi:hypothetical protein